MSTTVAQARDEMLGVLKAALAAESSYSSVLVIWDDTEKSPPKDVKVTWLRALVKHATGSPASLGGSDAKRKYKRTGDLIVQLFTPVGDGRSTADALVTIIMKAYEKGSTPNGVWFRNVRFKEIGLSDGWTQTNIYADFEYDELR
jgi:hypothetical protein